MLTFRIEQICKYTSMPSMMIETIFYKRKSNKQKQLKFKLKLIEWDRQLPIILMFYALMYVSSIDRGKKRRYKCKCITALYTIQHTKNKKVKTFDYICAHVRTYVCIRTIRYPFGFIIYVNLTQLFSPCTQFLAISCKNRCTIVQKKNYNVNVSSDLFLRCCCYCCCCVHFFCSELLCYCTRIPKSIYFSIIHNFKACFNFGSNEIQMLFTADPVDLAMVVNASPS